MMQPPIHVRRRITVRRGARLAAETRRADRRSDPIPIDAVVVAVPAHNEAARIEACLSSIDRTARSCEVTVVTVIAADGCTDATVRASTSFRAQAMAVSVMSGRWRHASPARRAAVAHGLELVGNHVHPARIWIANTDADCVVDANWLARQIAAANVGADVVAGVVNVDPQDTSPMLQAAFAAHYQHDTGRAAHVHAANLGIRASTYEQAGGWRASTVLGEEHHLVRSAGQCGAVVSHLGDLVVRTSGRTKGKAPGGFASTLRRLELLDRSMPESA